MKNIEIPQWPHAYGGPSGTGKIRAEPEDFIVNEMLSFEPSGEGEHVFLLIEKKGENTEFVARQLARFAGVRQRDIGYAGLKDRHAVTTQWFSVWLPGKEAPQWSDFESETITVHRSIRHARKLKRGILSGNRFELLIRDWQGDEKRLEDQLSRIKTCGVPNYFGEQRFGNLGQNVNKALALFEGAKVKREQRGIYLSAARSFLFNHILAERIRLESWNKPVDGDVFIVEGSRGFFKVDQIDPTISMRIDACEIHPSAVLCGQGASEATGEAWAIESAVIERFDFMVRGLFDCGLESARRALRMSLTDLEWRFISRGRLQLKFTLPAGSYATALLREIIES
ncbi:tRNA pseudouridine(13) synthase TruD [Methylotuvimicrobium alcaliphilum]|uniref:tRNA pseudouridine synthase D n=1 Tax=Methylotuvimicrobium alcaliphilum (strain DSM 19304 / NCIMB 14124 / VKM B-2133 / 20Z) TaxID=1091494 RepID=G4SXW0_META2|nr:tRNA pseudouridine(13) synthase TruD [Methylotuvimicrobium alcaliphilum]CCE23154.1 tRNA pseudouridine synthase D [Methylotuvimicrobium alcaliphilum 20Z]